MKKRNLFIKKTLIILFSLSLVALLSYLISFAFLNNNISGSILVNHDAVIAVKAGEAVSPPPITEQDWFVPVIASCVGLFALCIILGLGIGIPIAKKKEKKLLAERRENEALMQKIQEVSEEEAAIAEQQKTEELNNKENIQDSQEVHVEEKHAENEPFYPATGAAVPGQQLSPAAGMPMNQNLGAPGQQPNMPAFAGQNPSMINPQMMPGGAIQQRPGFNPALMNNPKQPGAYQQTMNRQQPGFANPMMNRAAAMPVANSNQQRFGVPQGQQRPMQQQMPFNNQQPGVNQPARQSQMRPLPQQGGYGPVPGVAAVPGRQQQPQQFGPRSMPQR